MVEPSVEEQLRRDKWPGQDKALPIGMAPPGTLAYEPSKRSHLSRGGLTPTYDGGYMDSPGKGLGQGNEGNFPSNSWLPSGQSDKSVSEDIQLGYPGTAEFNPTVSIETLEEAFGKEYAEIVSRIGQAVEQGASVEESIKTALEHTDHDMDPEVLRKAVNQYLGIEE